MTEHKSSTKGPKIAVLWRGDAEARRTATPQNNRFHRVFEGLAAIGVDAESAVYDEEFADEVRQQLLVVDGVLVWVDPIHQGKTRTALDPLLREVSVGPWVSAHPDVILQMGVKEVLYRTKHLGWGTGTYIYRTTEEFASAFPPRLRSFGPRVIKQNRGNGGQGVWKVEIVHGETSTVRVLHAQRGSMPEELALRDFVARCEPYFGWGGCIIDQPYQVRLPDGMIRCYMAGDRVAGFGHQYIKALIPPPPEGPDSPEAQPGPRIMHGPDAPQFQALRIKMETEWVPQMTEALDIERASLPIIWDADFLCGPRTASGEDSYVLCEINVSQFVLRDTGASAGGCRSPCLRSMRIGDQASWMIGAARRGLLVLALSLATASPSIAGPPYVTDDPEPTDTGHWENYLFTEITHVAGQSARPEPGIEINYGAFKDTQLTWSFPLTPNPGPGGIGVVWEPLGGGVKYRFIEEDDNGWRPQVAFFPQVFIPVGQADRGTPVTELFPIWLQKSLGPWTVFGGGGYTNNPGSRNKNFANYGIALQRQVLSNLALGVEVFGQGPDTTTDHGSAAIGLGAIFDFNDLWHLVGSTNTGISNAGADQFSFNLALKWTP